MTAAPITPGGEVLHYEAPVGQFRVDGRLDHDTVWLMQGQRQLFGREQSVIAKHVRNVFRAGKLEPEATCAKFAHAAEDGKMYQVSPVSKDLMIRLVINLLAEHRE